MATAMSFAPTVACSNNGNEAMIEQVQKAAEQFCTCPDRACQQTAAEAFKSASEKLLMKGKNLSEGQQALVEMASKRLSDCVRAALAKPKR